MQIKKNQNYQKQYSTNQNLKKVYQSPSLKKEGKLRDRTATVGSGPVGADNNATS